MTKMTAMCFMLLFLIGNAAVFAQDEPRLFGRIESSIKENEPRWKLQRRQLTNGGRATLYRWSSDSSAVHVFVFVLSSSEEATQEFKSLPSVMEADGIKMRVLDKTVPGLGDENYLWEGYYDKSAKGVDFRKARVIVHISATSSDIAKRFAEHIAEVISSPH